MCKSYLLYLILHPIAEVIQKTADCIVAKRHTLIPVEIINGFQLAQREDNA